MIQDNIVRDDNKVRINTESMYIYMYMLYHISTASPIEALINKYINVRPIAKLSQRYMESQSLQVTTTRLRLVRRHIKRPSRKGNRFV